jgi:hypothetical protein
MDPHLPAVMGALEEANEQFARNYAQYLTKLEASKAAHASRQAASAPTSATGAPAAGALARSSTGAGGVAASSAAAGASLSDMLHTAKRIMEPEQRKIPEDFNDTVRGGGARRRHESVELGATREAVPTRRGATG